jgi:DNA-directed RNA polymerase specialized sigma subunit
MNNAPYMRETERNLNIWERYKNGESQSAIARDIGISQVRVGQIIRVFKIRREGEE